MQVTEFKNQTFYFCVLALLGCLILYNCYVILTFREIWGIIPILIQAIIIGMILTKNQFAKIILKIWAIIFLVIGSSFQIILQAIQDFAENLEVDVIYYIVAGINLLVGSLIIYFTNTTVVVHKSEN